MGVCRVTSIGSADYSGAEFGEKLRKNNLAGSFEHEVRSLILLTGLEIEHGNFSSVALNTVCIG